jgi:hypothetical protein
LLNESSIIILWEDLTMTTNPCGVAALVMRVQEDFLATPSLSLTAAEAERRFGLDRPSCEAVLEALADATVLRRERNGTYRRFFPHLAHAA